MPEPFKGTLATVSQDSQAPTPFKQSPASKRHGPSSAGRPASQSIKFRSEPCKHWAKGTCFNGDRCLWRHEGAAGISPCLIAASPSHTANVAAERTGDKVAKTHKTHQTLHSPTAVRPQLANPSKHQGRMVTTTSPRGRVPRINVEGARNKGKTHNRLETEVKNESARFRDIEKPQRLPSYVAQEAYLRRQEQQLEIERYMGDPPAGIQLIQLRMVLPRELGSLDSLDDTRRDKAVWITRVERNVIGIHAESMKALREALKEINWFVHDTLREEVSKNPRLFLQFPTQATDQSRISLSASRPQVKDPARITSDVSVAVEKAAKCLAIELGASANALLGGIKEVEMRVNFGLMRLEHTRSSLGRNVSYGDLERLLKIYCHRGSTKFETRFIEPNRAEILLLHLLDPASGACKFPELVRESCSITFSAKDQELSADIIGPSNSHPQLASVRLVEREPWPRLNVIAVAPDLKYDWNLQAQSSGYKEVPEQLDKLIMKLKLGSVRRHGPKDILKQPRIEYLALGDFGNHVSETRLRTSAVVPWKATPYLIEIGITTTWRGVNLGTRPRIHWDVQFYGSHWDSAVNRTRSDMRRKDWGENMCDVWIGEAPSLEGRLGSFLEEVLDLQSMLERFS